MRKKRKHSRPEVEEEAPKGKKGLKAAADLSEDTEGEEEASDSDVEVPTAGETVEVEYDFREFAPALANGVMALLEDHLPGAPNPDSVEKLAGLCAQTPYTTVVVVPEDDEHQSSTAAVGGDCHGVISLVSLSAATSDGTKALQLLLGHLPTEYHAYFTTLCSKHRVGWVLMERLLDSTLLGVQMFVSTVTEYLEKAQKQQQQPQRKLQAKTTPAEAFDYFVVLAQVTPPAVLSAAQQTQEPQKKRKQNTSTTAASVVAISPWQLSSHTLLEAHFPKGEDYACWQHRDASVPTLAVLHGDPTATTSTTSTTSEPSNVEESTPSRDPASSSSRYSLPVVFPYTALPDILRELKAQDGYFASEMLE